MFLLCAILDPLVGEAIDLLLVSAVQVGMHQLVSYNMLRSDVVVLQGMEECISAHIGDVRRRSVSGPDLLISSVDAEVLHQGRPVASHRKQRSKSTVPGEDRHQRRRSPPHPLERIQPAPVHLWQRSTDTAWPVSVRAQLADSKRFDHPL